ncbi:UdgX family uracil-DNA binding protein [Microbacterium aerolatum]|uniref:Type-4 uracil-DNA glycosylase n=1 Tax=Microbacterium aerolatum TaxID=153731 RepID=A0A511ALN5_9MICO|nr:UdgX family uracil-DNA binding protein [Microbacterium aerolatum]GEK87771.1 uracil-DNA glycosylase [Microbacterium aerolatum]GGB17589.1 uracil-DNA glycosylase [Microbacterium aerolatum]
MAGQGASVYPPNMSKTAEQPGADQWVPPHAAVDDLRRAAEDCRGCELWRDATQVVFSRGPAGAAIMLVGEQPGDREDLEGEPFIGPAGQILVEAITAADLAEDDVYMTNAVKHFRFERRGKRRIHDKPAVGHIVACHPWLEAEVAAVTPEVLVALGATAARSVLGRTVKIGEVRGRVLEPPAGFASPVVVTAHPSSILRVRDSADRESAFNALVEDLRLAADLIAR